MKPTLNKASCILYLAYIDDANSVFVSMVEYRLHNAACSGLSAHFAASLQVRLGLPPVRRCHNHLELTTLLCMGMSRSGTITIVLKGYVLF